MQPLSNNHEEYNVFMFIKGKPLICKCNKCNSNIASNNIVYCNRCNEDGEDYWQLEAVCPDCLIVSEITGCGNIENTKEAIEHLFNYLLNKKQ